MEAAIPKFVSSAQLIAYLRTLADTGNAPLAAEQAGVSRDWAYKRRERDAGFDRLCREMAALAKARLPVRVNRDRKGGWSAAKEARFIERMRATASAWLAAAAVGLSTGSAYRRRQRRPEFALAWDEAQRIGWPPADQPWIESAICFFEGRSPPPDNPVRITNIGQVIEAMRGNRFVRPPRAKRPRGSG